MYLSAHQIGKLLQRQAAVFVQTAHHRNSYQHLVGVQARITSVEILHLQFLDGLDHRLGNQLYIVSDAGQVLDGIQQQRGAGAQQRTGFPGQDRAVRKLDGGGCLLGLLQALAGRHGALAVVHGNLSPLHHQADFVHLPLAGLAVGKMAKGREIAADDLLLGGPAAQLVVVDAIAYHIYAHIGGRFIRSFPVNILEKGVHHRENLYVTVIIDSRLPIGFKVERVYHIDVFQVGRRGFVSQVHRMGQGKVPDGESFEFGITGLHAPFVLLVELAQAYGHLPASRTGGGNHHQGAGGFHIVVPAKAFVRINQGHVVRITLDGVMVIDPDVHLLQAFAVGFGTALAIEMGDDHAVDAKAARKEFLPQAQDIHVVGDSQVVTDFVLFDVHRTDDDDNLQIFL